MNTTIRTFTRPMQWLVLLAGLLLLAACTGDPELTVAPSEIDLGEIAADAPVTATVHVQNTGTSELHITGVTTSCGCTSAELAHDRLAAGATALLTVQFDPQTHPGLYGPVLRMVYLHSNDPAQAEVEVPLHVNILQP